MRAIRLAQTAGACALKSSVKAPPDASTFWSFGHRGHRIYLSEDVHESGSIPEVDNADEGCTATDLNLAERQIVRDDDAMQSR